MQLGRAATEVEQQKEGAKQEFRRLRRECVVMERSGASRAEVETKVTWCQAAEDRVAGLEQKALRISKAALSTGKLEVRLQAVEPLVELDPSTFGDMVKGFFRRFAKQEASLAQDRAFLDVLTNNDWIRSGSGDNHAEEMHATIQRYLEEEERQALPDTTAQRSSARQELEQ